MNRKRSWSNNDLIMAVATSKSVRGTIIKLGLIPAGGNYQHVTSTIKSLSLDISHFTGMGWRKGRTFAFIPQKSLAEILVEDSDFQSFKLKKRLYREGLKQETCELCGWAEKSKDGRIPLELDHVNGNHRDNRLDNLRILCPNCHSLQSTHRGRNQKKLPGWRNR